MKTIQKALTGLALVVALSGCGGKNKSQNKQKFPIQIIASEIIIPSQYKDLELLSAGYFGTDLKFIRNARAPWVSFKDSDNNLVLSYIENKKWHETRINKNELPSRVQNLEFLSAGYFGTDLGYITATRAPWVSFKDPEGKILVYYKEDNKWHETVMRTK